MGCDGSTVTGFVIGAPASPGTANAPGTSVADTCGRGTRNVSRGSAAGNRYRDHVMRSLAGLPFGSVAEITASRTTQ